MEIILKQFADVLKKGFGESFIAGDTIKPVSGAISPGRPRLMLVLNGCRHIVIDQNGKNTEIALNQGDLMFAGKMAWHKPLDRSRNTIFTIIVDSKYLNLQCKENLPGRKKSILYCNRYYPITHPIHYMVRALDSAGNGEIDLHEIFFALTASAYKLALHEIRKPEGKPEGKALQTFRIVQDFLRDNLHRSINRDSVAWKFRLHPNHLSRLFKEHSGEGFTDYLTRIRLEYAEILLQNPKYTLKQIANYCGFANENYFGKVFRKKNGISPRKFGWL